MPVFYLDALARFRADAFTALTQLNSYTSSHLSQQVNGDVSSQRQEALEKSYKQRLQTIADLAKPGVDGHFSTSYLTSRIRHFCPQDTIWCIEAVTQTVFVADQIQATLPGSWINCGGGGLGWSGGAALGIKLATDKMGAAKFVCHIVGDGTFLFTVPGSVYWIAQRYNIPILTIVLNNKGWNAPRRSLLLVHPHGEASKVSNEELNISFAPTPDYAGIAKAAAGGNLYAAQAGTVEELERVLKEAVESVNGGVSAVVEARLEGS
jgi:thiamine pyrophosphate-dependent acetolactate synthase large subunit-like protein